MPRGDEAGSYGQESGMGRVRGGGFGAGPGNNIDRTSKKNAVKALQAQTLHHAMASIKHKFLFMSTQGRVGTTSVLAVLAMALSKESS